MKWTDALYFVLFALGILPLLGFFGIKISPAITIDGYAQIILAILAIYLVLKYEYSSPSVIPDISFIKISDRLHPVVTLTLLSDAGLTEGDVRFELYSNLNSYSPDNEWVLITGESDRKMSNGYHRYVAADLIFPGRFKISGRGNSVLLRLPSIPFRRTENEQLGNDDLQLQIFVAGKAYAGRIGIAQALLKAESS